MSSDVRVEAARRAHLERLVVAADDKEIGLAVEAFSTLYTQRSS